MTKGLLIILSGKPEVLTALLRSADEVQHIETQVEDERSFLTFRSLFRAARTGRHEIMAIGCTDLSRQRYQFFLKLSLVASLRTRVYLVDEGSVKRVSTLRFFFADVPLFLAELVASGTLVILSGLHLLWQKTVGAGR